VIVQFPAEYEAKEINLVFLSWFEFIKFLVVKVGLYCLSISSAVCGLSVEVWIINPSTGGLDFTVESFGITYLNLYRVSSILLVSGILFINVLGLTSVKGIELIFK